MASRYGRALLPACCVLPSPPTVSRSLPGPTTDSSASGIRHPEGLPRIGEGMAKRCGKSLRSRTRPLYLPGEDGAVVLWDTAGKELMRLRTD